LAAASDQGESIRELSNFKILKERDDPTTVIGQHAISAMGNLAKLEMTTVKVTQVRHEKSVTLKASIKLGMDINTTAKGLIGEFRLMSWFINGIYKTYLRNNLIPMYRVPFMSITEK